MTTPYLRYILGPHTDKTLSELDQYTVCYGECARSFRDVAERDIPKWDSLDAEQRAAEIARVDHEADERAKAHDDERMRSLEDQWQPPSDDELIGWHDVTRSADYWFDPEQVVSPEQAAMLMVGWNPLTDGAPDTSKSDDDPEKLKQYRLFKFRFESAEIRDSKPRTLREWVPLAMDAGLNKSAWVNEYMSLIGIKSERASAELNATKQHDATTDSSPSAHPMRQQRQEHEILRVLREMDHDPLALPKWDAGKPGVKADVRKVLQWQGKVFDKAWERLRQSERIRDAGVSPKLG